MRSHSGRRALVIGAGIVGLACARSLHRESFSVTVIERGDPGGEASFGNAGGIAATEVVPAALPGVLGHVPGWLLDPLGPLALRWRHLPQLLPWLRAFVASARRERVERSAAAMGALLAPVYDDVVPLLEELNLGSLLHRRGALTVYESERSFAASGYAWDIKRRNGILIETLDADGVRALEPALAPMFPRGVHTPQWSHVGDPHRIVLALADRLRAEGVGFVRDEAVAFDGRDGRIDAVTTAGGERVGCDIAVVAAGPWSARLCRVLGERVLLESERGYHMTLPRSGVAVTREIVSGDRHFVITPMDMGLRLAGTAEFAGLEAPANWRRADVLLRHARRFFPGIDGRDASRWMGQRPSTPDSLPVIGPSARWSNVYHAFGHGHLGLTLAATTGRLVAECAAGRTPDVDIAPFAVSRFSS